MKKEYVVTNISAAPDGSPYVLVTLNETTDMNAQQEPPGRASVGAFAGDPESLMSNINRLLLQQMGKVATTLKMDMADYEEAEIRVGDRVTLEIKKKTLET